MKTVFRATAALAILATAGQAAQTVKQQACLTSEETRALFLAVAPDVMRSVTGACMNTLPANAYLRVNGGALAQRYAAPAAAAKSAAMAAINKISGDTPLPPEMFEFVVQGMIGEIAADKIKPQDCAKIDRAAELLDPLPPANLAGLIALVMEFAGEDEKKASPLKICKPAG